MPFSDGTLVSSSIWGMAEDSRCVCVGGGGGGIRKFYSIRP